MGPIVSFPKMEKLIGAVVRRFTMLDISKDN